ncbi:CAP domain-containing protein [Streptomyces alanosinicus]|nr:CAP domain-containing protein [Streptomyces alanosinicus]
MGRHRRSAAGRAATGRAAEDIRTQTSDTGSGDPRDTHARVYAGEIVRRDQIPRGIAPYLNPEAHRPATGRHPLDHPETTAKAHAYLFANENGGAGGSGSGGGGFTPTGEPSADRRRRKKGPKPVRASLLGVSAAFALGAAAVASGVVPGLQNYKLGGDTSTSGDEQAQAALSPSNTAVAQGGASGSANSDTGLAGSHAGVAGTSRGSARPGSPSSTASPSTSQPASATATPSKTAKTPAGNSASHATPAAKPKNTPSKAAGKAPKANAAPKATSAANAAEAEVLRLVNQERSKVGCSPLSANPALTKLAESFSDDMAARGFFDHTDPDGKTPWDRAATAGITNLGGENIARGQADPAAVMKAWMNSPGHKANILNCDFKTLGVGVHIGPGGPWWTQDFGY